MAATNTRSQLPQVEIRKTFAVLLENIRHRRVEKVKELLTIIPAADAKQILLYTDNECETILHTAVKFHCPSDIVLCLLDACPELLVASREESALYKGQTALHIAVTGGNVTLTTCLLEKAKVLGQSVLNDLLLKCATGAKFESTVLLGELPLIVAALTFNTEIMNKLIQYGAELESRNSRGDNAIHSLIRYAFLYPEKLDGVLNICDYVAKLINNSVDSLANPADIDYLYGRDDIESTVQIWLSKNSDSLNPLQLSAYYGQHAIFKFIMEMRGVYCYVNSEDGLFDVELYDVTDIDTVQKKRSSKVDPFDKDDNTIPEWLLQNPLDFTDSDAVYKTPTLEMMFNAQPGVVFKFIEMTPLRYVINKKWSFYRWFYALWGCLHMLFMIGFTVYAVRRSDVEAGPEKNRRYVIGQSGFETFYVALSVLVAILYFVQEVTRIIKGQMAWTKHHVMNCYHNGPFRLILLVFSLTVFVDSIWAISDRNHKDYLLVCAMILGWWFLVFFLRGLRQFSFFTVMIQKVLVGDMFRFSIIISMELVAFTAGLFIAFRGSVTIEENVYSFSKLTVLMFQMMFGFTSLDVLFEAREAWFAVCLYVAFVILTYVLMINSLIAMMSNTCSIISQNREIQFRVQQLSIILFFESIFPMSWKRLAGSPRLCSWYDYKTCSFTKRNRYLMEVRSLHEVTQSKSIHRPNPETMLETIFHTIQKIQLPKILDSPVEIVREAFDSASQPQEDNEDPVPDTSRSRSHKKKKKKKKKRDIDSESPMDEVDITTSVSNPEPNYGTNEVNHAMFF